MFMKVASMTKLKKNIKFVYPPKILSASHVRLLIETCRYLSHNQKKINTIMKRYMLIDKYATLTAKYDTGYWKLPYIKHFHNWERHLKMCLRNLISSLSRFVCSN